MFDTLEGIVDRLERADENIRNLESEISRFFQGCQYPVIPPMDDEKHLEAIEYFRDLKIPLRFSVLAGEVVHHLRSSLDNITWALSSETSRNGKDARYIEFPILETRPKDKASGYDRKIHGITSVKAIELIEALQPYNRFDPIDDPLLIIHRMDVADKHCGLVLVASTGYVEAPPHLAFVFYKHLGPPVKPFSAELKREFGKHAKITAQIAFPEFGRRKIQPIVPGLAQLANYVREVIALLCDVV